MELLRHGWLLALVTALMSIARVDAAPAARIVVSDMPFPFCISIGSAIACPSPGLFFQDPPVAGYARYIFVYAPDADGVLRQGYGRTWTFTSSDVDSRLPQPYTFAPSDVPAKQFVVTLYTPGTQTIAVSDGAGLSGMLALDVAAVVPVAVPLSTTVIVAANCEILIFAVLLLCRLTTRSTRRAFGAPVSSVR
jgi:hypothetical protein